MLRNIYWYVSRFSYVYMVKHKYETFEVFETFQNEVENQLGQKDQDA